MPPVVPEALDLVGAVEGHPAGCFVQLYGRRDLGFVRVTLPQGCPAVMGRCTVQGTVVTFVAAHLFPHLENAEERSKQVRQICSARSRGAFVLMGDLNVRRDEVGPLCEGHGLRDMPYSGSSWSPVINRFYENLQSYRRLGEAFDRIWSAGEVWVEGHMVGACRTYCSGESFFLSDHFGLLGFMDVHAAYGVVGGGNSEVARKRREALGSLRTESVMAEKVLTRDRERQGEQERALEAERAAQRERGESLRAVAQARLAERRT